MEFASVPGPDSGSGWAGQGEARVTPQVDGERVRLLEEGQFTPHHTGTSFTFRNIYRWWRHGSRITLCHERFGANAPVHLLDLVEDESGALVCEAPHHCAADIYHARLDPVSDGLLLTWRIRGPRKDELLRYRYRL